MKSISCRERFGFIQVAVAVETVQYVGCYSCVAAYYPSRAELPECHEAHRRPTNSPSMGGGIYAV